MHELSIVMGIIEIAERQAKAADATIIDEVELDIGTLSGIETEALEFAWKQGVRQTMLEYAVKKINQIAGKARCLDCDAEFAIEKYEDACPICGEHLLDIIQGKELRVKSLLVS
ncbi:hydrogenase maturation nickel metallochaperone HypA [Mucilaginibacter sp. UR6-11]|uniref:hydrogenase maturation nickel metallochaperone HypA n=1 Tax=Mucilaginibacter sp. UR6-11 TaxID=1435644 RepID=UPI001E48AFA5|nr:hydrogenase maturation nickel metallochaperone HypA [Mucilaginibacter sp. UR6-11]MCC8423512.1 hydrogenase maturation nickel metallochaperone HypA [Mucilaginibacter sp. UR6-11]